jgi:hypothetical protein
MLLSQWLLQCRICSLESRPFEKFLDVIIKMWMSLYAAVLFFVLTPGVLLSLPPGGSRTTVALTHAVVFGIVWALTHKAIYRALGM